MKWLERWHFWPELKKLLDLILGILQPVSATMFKSQSITGSMFINRSSKVWCQLHLVLVWNKMGSCIHLEQQEAGVLRWARWAQLPFAAAQISTNSSLHIVFEKKVSCSTWGLVHLLSWCWFPHTVPRSGTEGHLFWQFYTQLRSRLLLKAPLRHQSCARAGKRQAGECQRANRERIPADSTSPLLKEAKGIKILRIIFN